MVIVGNFLRSQIKLLKNSKNTYSKYYILYFKSMKNNKNIYSFEIKSFIVLIVKQY